MDASVWLQEFQYIEWKISVFFTMKVLKVGLTSEHRLESWTMTVFSWLQLVRRHFGILTIVNERSTKICLKVDYLFTAVVLKLKMCPKSRYWISVHPLESCTMKASCWIQLVRRDFGMLLIYWMKVVLQSLEKKTIFSLLWYWKWWCAPIVDTEFQYKDSSLAQWKHRYDCSWFAVTSVCCTFWMKVVLKSLEK